MKTSYEILQAAYRRFRDAFGKLITWECGLAYAIVLSTYHFHEFISMCKKIYNSTQRDVMSLDGSRVIFLVCSDAIYEMLLSLDNQTLIYEEALVA
jgi:hypothetical protein